MDAVKIKCRDLMVGDWITDKNGFQWQIIGVGDDYAYATFEGNEGDPWEFNDKDDQPEGIPLTKEILDNNGFRCKHDYGSYYREIIGSHHYTSPICVSVEWWNSSEGRKIIYIYIDCANENGCGRENIVCLRDALFVHTLQHALRLVRLSEIADNFKV